MLQDAGYPIAGDERGRLSRPRLLSSYARDIRFAPAELDALLVAVAQAQAAVPNADPLASAVLKLRAFAESAQNSGAPALKLTDLPDSGVQRAFRAGGPFEIRRWILGWGDAVEVISPNNLREELRRVLRAAFSVYER